MRIQVDFDALMDFGKFYRDLGDGLDFRVANQLSFDGQAVQRVVNEYGLHINTSNRHFAGNSMPVIRDDAVERANRVVHYLKDCSSDLFLHAADLNQTDDSFSWSNAALSSAGFLAAGWSSFTSGPAALIEKAGGLVVDTLQLPEVIELLKLEGAGKLFTRAFEVVGVPFDVAALIKAFEEVGDNPWALLEGALSTLSLGVAAVKASAFAAAKWGIAALGVTTLAPVAAVVAKGLLVVGAGVLAFEASKWLTEGLGDWIGGGIYNTWNYFASGDAASDLLGFGNAAWDFAGGVWDTTVDFGSDVWDLGTDMFDTALDFGGAAWDSVVDFGSGVWNGLFGSEGVVNEHWDRAIESVGVIDGLLGGPLISFGRGPGTLGNLDHLLPPDRFESFFPGGHELSHLQGLPSQERGAHWASLPPDVRDNLMEHAPRSLGNLDGLPVDVRFEANRTTIRQELREAERNGDGERAKLLRGLGGENRNFLFLDLDAPGGGRIAEVHGDLDAAHNVVVVVPGVNNDISHFSNPTSDHLLVGGAERIYDRSGPSTAVVAWLGYDTPEADFSEVESGTDLLGAAGNALSAADEVRAREGAADLRSFIDRNTERIQNVTVVGHSYGSTTAGIAASEGMPKVDNLVLLGSPGGGADSAGEYQLDRGGRVFAASAPGDPVRWAPTSETVDAAIGILTLNPLAPLLVDYDPLGKDPTGDDFGAEVFNADHLGSSHSRYLEEGPLLDQIIRRTVDLPPGATDLDYGNMA